MIFFSGWGAVLVPIFFGVGALCVQLVSLVVGLKYQYVAISLGGIVAAALCWWSGMKLNDRNRDRLAVDEKTGAAIRIGRRHTLMFIPIQWWAIPMLLLFVLIAFGS